jgi:tagaturonate reductase
MIMKSLKRTNFSHLPNLPVKVVQFGAGSFLRGFVDWIVDVMNEKQCFLGHIQIIQSVSSSADNSLNDQDGLYHVVTKGIEAGKTTEQIRLISCVRATINAQEDPQRFFEIAANADLQFLHLAKDAFPEHFPVK